MMVVFTLDLNRIKNQRLMGNTIFTAFVIPKRIIKEFIIIKLIK
jgi:hypothetical protein